MLPSSATSMVYRISMAETDADAVFGLMYAQCEDDFQRVEMNYIEKLGTAFGNEGEKFIG